ncbi:hypothetical protein TNCV_2766711 [Trichonephila clavipes]|nr:hypothetical protein TNCV_2766711 [Trichonephila clavipes]
MATLSAIFQRLDHDPIVVFRFDKEVGAFRWTSRENVISLHQSSLTNCDDDIRKSKKLQIDGPIRTCRLRNLSRKSSLAFFPFLL